MLTKGGFRATIKKNTELMMFGRQPQNLYQIISTNFKIYSNQLISMDLRSNLFIDLAHFMVVSTIILVMGDPLCPFALKEGTKIGSTMNWFVFRSIDLNWYQLVDIHWYQLVDINWYQLCHVMCHIIWHNCHIICHILPRPYTLILRIKSALRITWAQP